MVEHNRETMKNGGWLRTTMRERRKELEAAWRSKMWLWGRFTIVFALILRIFKVHLEPNPARNVLEKLPEDELASLKKKVSTLEAQTVIAFFRMC